MLAERAAFVEDQDVIPLRALALVARDCPAKRELVETAACAPVHFMLGAVEEVRQHAGGKRIALFVERGHDRFDMGKAAPAVRERYVLGLPHAAVEDAGLSIIAQADEAVPDGWMPRLVLARQLLHGPDAIVEGRAAPVEAAQHLIGLDHQLATVVAVDRVAPNDLAAAERTMMQAAALANVHTHADDRVIAGLPVDFGEHHVRLGVDEEPFVFHWGQLRRVGETLTATLGAWINSATSYARQWYRDGDAISDASGATYILVEADLGTMITHGVIAANAIGSSAEAISAGVGPIEDAPVEPVLPGSIEDLTATAQSDSEVLLGWTPATGATSHEYRVDGGAWIACDDNSGSQLVAGLTAETEYAFEVRGVNADGAGPASNTDTAKTEETPPEPVLTAPVLSNLASGWAPGDNPPAWSAYYADAVGYGDGKGSEVRARWRIDGAEWTTEAWEGLDDELITGELTWPLLEAADLSAGGFFEVQEQHVIDRGLETERLSYWSNVWSDALNEIVVPTNVVPTHRQTAILDYNYGTTPPAIPAGFAIEDGDKLVLHLAIQFNGASNTVTSITANGGAISFTQIGALAGTGNEKAATWYADTSGVTSITDLAIAVSGSTNCIGYSCFTVAAAAAGAPSDSYREIRSVTNEDPHDVDGGLAAPANGALLLLAGAGTPTPSFTWSGAVEQSEVNNAATDTNLTISGAIQTTAANVTIRGQAGGGPQYAYVFIANTTWEAA